MATAGTRMYLRKKSFLLDAPSQSQTLKATSGNRARQDTNVVGQAYRNSIETKVALTTFV